MNSTKIKDLHPVEILILVFLAVTAAVVTIATELHTILFSAKKTSCSATDVSSCQQKTLSKSLKNSGSAPEKNQLLSQSILSSKLTLEESSQSTSLPTEPIVSSVASKQSELPQKPTGRGSRSSRRKAQSQKLE